MAAAYMQPGPESPLVSIVPSTKYADGGGTAARGEVGRKLQLACYHMPLSFLFLLTANEAGGREVATVNLLLPYAVVYLCKYKTLWKDRQANDVRCEIGERRGCRVLQAGRVSLEQREDNRIRRWGKKEGG